MKITNTAGVLSRKKWRCTYRRLPICTAHILRMRPKTEFKYEIQTCELATKIVFFLGHFRIVFSTAHFHINMEHDLNTYFKLVRTGR